MKRIRFVIIVTLLAIAVVVPAIRFIPIPAQSSLHGAQFYNFLDIEVAAMILFIGDSILFLLGLKEFTAKLKLAYTLFCLGMMALGVAQLQIPLAAMYDLLNSFYARSGIIIIPYLAPYFLLYIGASKFARLFNVRGFFSSFWRTLGIAVGLAVCLGFFLPHAHTATPEAQFRGTLTIAVFACWFVISLTVLVFQVRRRAGAAYTNALAWMALALLLLTIYGVHFLLVLVLLGDNTPYYVSGWISSWYLPIGLLLMRAAYSFNSITTRHLEAGSGERTFFGNLRQPKADTATTSLDIVMYAAQLASDPTEIDTLLDEVRFVSAHLHPGEAPSSADNARLCTAYRGIEQYLTTQEPVRKFTAASLRATIQEALRLNQPEIANKTFWPQLSPVV